jgi:hypothetical protein
MSQLTHRPFLMLLHVGCGYYWLISDSGWWVFDFLATPLLTYICAHIYTYTIFFSHLLNGVILSFLVKLIVKILSLWLDKYDSWVSQKWTMLIFSFLWNDFFKYFLVFYMAITKSVPNSAAELKICSWYDQTNTSGVTSILVFALETLLWNCSILLWSGLCSMCTLHTIFWPSHHLVSLGGGSW